MPRATKGDKPEKSEVDKSLASKGTWPASVCWSDVRFGKGWVASDPAKVHEHRR